MQTPKWKINSQSRNALHENSIQFKCTSFIHLKYVVSTYTYNFKLTHKIVQYERMRTRVCV